LRKVGVGASSEEGKKGFSYKCAEDNGTDYVNTSISGRSMRKGRLFVRGFWLSALGSASSTH
jgi:hypothetical protein